MRLGRNELHMAVAMLMATRATCTRAQVGCVFTKNGRIVATGYNGAPTGMPHCLDEGCLLNPDTGSCERCVHAEAAAISFAARHGISLEGTTLYVTHSPCLACAKLIINAGVHTVIYKEEYGKSAVSYLDQAGMTKIKL